MRRPFAAKSPYMVSIACVALLLTSRAALPASTLIESLPLPEVTPGTLVKNEQMLIAVTVAIPDQDIEKPRLQVFDKNHDQDGKWVNVGPLKEIGTTGVSDQKSYSGIFSFLDTGLTTYADKKGWSKISGRLASVSSPAELRLYSGSVSDSEKAYVSPAFSLSFLDIDLPPDPGSSGRQTVQGIDSDGDRIRDDVQRYIVLTYPDSTRTIEAALQHARAVLPAVEGAVSAESVRGLADSEDLAIDCMEFIREDDFERVGLQLVSEVVNTGERLANYLSYDARLKGQVFEATPIDDLASSCDFEIDGEEN